MIKRIINNNVLIQLSPQERVTAFGGLCYVNHVRNLAANADYAVYQAFVGPIVGQANIFARLTGMLSTPAPLPLVTIPASVAQRILCKEWFEIYFKLLKTSWLVKSGLVVITPELLWLVDDLCCPPETVNPRSSHPLDQELLRLFPSPEPLITGAIQWLVKGTHCGEGTARKVLAL